MDKLPFISVLAKAVTKLIPSDESLDPTLIEQSSSIALGQAKEEILKMGYITVRGLKESLQYLLSNQNKHREAASQFDGVINNLDGKITGYLTRLAEKDLSNVESNKYFILTNARQDIETIGNHFAKIMEIAENQINTKTYLPEIIMTDIKGIFQGSIDMFEQAIIAFDHYDLDSAKDAISKGTQMEKILIRQTTNGPDRTADLVLSFRAIRDHAVNIAAAVIGERQ
ncbi:Na/Pi cotransporter family protein [Bacillus sp. V59.32b]|uniref:Na/Pi cotransporter family protein n=1 Tax=Bacillus sp. V59.32b TaxID=1758642 RepID=UPI000E3DD4E7|nr:Na/Pi cotransporter family protein [Bacillus sp. V59.32b]RFU61879.1 Na/Pi cotransporter family protein [Bacillus sp. V59.32b]